MIAPDAAEAYRVSDVEVSPRASRASRNSSDEHYSSPGTQPVRSLHHTPDEGVPSGFNGAVVEVNSGDELLGSPAHVAAVHPAPAAGRPPPETFLQSGGLGLIPHFVSTTDPEPDNPAPELPGTAETTAAPAELTSTGSAPSPSLQAAQRARSTSAVSCADQTVAADASKRDSQMTNEGSADGPEGEAPKGEQPPPAPDAPAAPIRSKSVMQAKQKLKLKVLLNKKHSIAEEDRHVTDKQRMAEQKIHKMLYQLPAFAPDWGPRRWWDVLIMWLILYHIVIGSLTLVLSITPTLWIISIEIPVSIALFLDVVINCNTAVQQRSRDFTLLTERREIMWHYFSSGDLPMDLLGGLPFDLLSWLIFRDPLIWWCCRGLRLTKIFKLPRLLRMTERGTMDAAYVRFYFWISPLLWLLWKMLCSGHALTLGRVIVAPDRNGTSEGCNEYGQDACTNDPATKYFYAFFWVWALLTGQGLTALENQGVFAYAAFVLAVGLFMQGHIVATMSAMMLKSNVEEQNRDSMRSTLALLVHYNIPRTLQQEVLSFQFHSLQQNAAAGSLGYTLSGLPEGMKREVGLYIRVDLVEKVPMFTDINRHCQMELASCLQESFAEPDDLLIKNGDEGHEMYFLMHGYADVIIYPPGSGPAGITVATVKRGDFFGEVALLVPGTPRTASIQALTYCAIFTLRYPDFARLLTTYEDLSERMHEEATRRGLTVKKGPPPPLQSARQDGEPRSDSPSEDPERQRTAGQSSAEGGRSPRATGSSVFGWFTTSPSAPPGRTGPPRFDADPVSSEGQNVRRGSLTRPGSTTVRGSMLLRQRRKLGNDVALGVGGGTPRMDPTERRQSVEARPPIPEPDFMRDLSSAESLRSGDVKTMVRVFREAEQDRRSVMDGPQLRSATQTMPALAPNRGDNSGHSSHGSPRLHPADRGHSDNNPFTAIGSGISLDSEGGMAAGARDEITLQQALAAAGIGSPSAQPQAVPPAARRRNKSPTGQQPVGGTLYPDDASVGLQRVTSSSSSQPLSHAGASPAEAEGPAMRSPDLGPASTAAAPVTRAQFERFASSVERSLQRLCADMLVRDALLLRRMHVLEDRTRQEIQRHQCAARPGRSSIVAMSDTFLRSPAYRESALPEHSGEAFSPAHSIASLGLRAPTATATHAPSFRGGFGGGPVERFRRTSGPPAVTPRGHSMGMGANFPMPVGNPHCPL